MAWIMESRVERGREVRYVLKEVGRGVGVAVVREGEGTRIVVLGLVVTLVGIAVVVVVVVLLVRDLSLEVKAEKCRKDVSVWWCWVGWR
jgi:hypothetical protein